MYKTNCSRAAKFLAAFCFLLLPLNAFAQHCPFDGTSMVVIHLVDQKGKDVAKFEGDLALREVGNDHPELCTYAPDIVKQNFLEAKTAFYETRDTDRFKDTLDKYCPECTFLEPGYYAAKLNQATEECMIKNGGDFDYKPRKYEVQVSHGGETQNVPVPQDRIYSLCTAQGRWSRIQPVRIVVKSKKERKAGNEVSIGNEVTGS